MIWRPSDISRRGFLRHACAPFLGGMGGSRLWAAQGPAPRGAASLSNANAAFFPQISFRDVAAEAGITPKPVCGNPEKNYIVEVYGSGCVWFDYNNNGWKDTFIVNGHLYPKGDGFFGDEDYLQNPQLFANQGNGKFLEVSSDVYSQPWALSSGHEDTPAPCQAPAPAGLLNSI